MARRRWRASEMPPAVAEVPAAEIDFDEGSTRQRREAIRGLPPGRSASLPPRALRATKAARDAGRRALSKRSIQWDGPAGLAAAMGNERDCAGAHMRGAGVLRKLRDGRPRPCMLQLNVKHLNFPMSGSACAGGDAHPRASEVHLLLACARQHNHAHSPSQLQDLLDHPIEWNALTALAARHRVRPLLHEALAAANWRNVPAEVRESLRAFAESHLHRNLTPL